MSAAQVSARSITIGTPLGVKTGARRAAFAITLTIAAIAGGYGVSTGSPKLTAALFALAIAGALAVVVPLRSIATALLFLAGATAGVNSARVGGSFTLTDACILGAALILLPSLALRRRVDGISGLYLVASSLIVLGAFLGAMSSSQYSANLAPTVKLVIAAFMVYAVFLAWAPTIREGWIFVGLYVASAAVSGLWGVTHLNPWTQRADGLMVHSNHLALVSLLALGPATVAAFYLSGRWCVAGVLASATLVVGIGASGSRAGLVGVTLIALVAAAFLTRHRAARAVVIVTLGVAIAFPLVVFVSPNQNAFARAFDSSSASAQQSNVGRRAALSESIGLIDDHPLTGAGLEAAKQPHDIFLGLLAGGGPVALLGVLLLVLVPVRALWAARRVDPPSLDHLLVIGLSLGMIGFFVACLFQNTIWDRYIWLPLALLTFTMGSLSNGWHRRPSRPATRTVAFGASDPTSQAGQRGTAG